MLDEIVPILMVLKKMTTTPRENTSLWIVMTRRLVNMQVERAMMNPVLMPSVFATSKDKKGDDLSVRKVAEDSNEMTDQRFGESNADIFNL